MLSRPLGLDVLVGGIFPLPLVEHIATCLIPNDCGLNRLFQVRVGLLEDKTIFVRALEEAVDDRGNGVCQQSVEYPFFPLATPSVQCLVVGICCQHLHWVEVWVRVPSWRL